MTKAKVPTSPSKVSKPAAIDTNANPSPSRKQLISARIKAMGLTPKISKKRNSTKNKKKTTTPASNKNKKNEENKTNETNVNITTADNPSIINPNVNQETSQPKKKRRRSKRPMKRRREPDLKFVGISEIDLELKEFKCPRCPKIFKTTNELFVHMRKVYENPASCHLCGKNCSSLANTLSHSYVHRNIKPYKCPRCEYKTRTRFNLKVHLGSCAGLSKFKYRRDAPRNRRFNNGEPTSPCIRKKGSFKGKLKQNNNPNNKLHIMTQSQGQFTYYPPNINNININHNLLVPNDSNDISLVMPPPITNSMNISINPTTEFINNNNNNNNNNNIVPPNTTKDNNNDITMTDQTQNVTTQQTQELQNKEENEGEASAILKPLESQNGTNVGTIDETQSQLQNEIQNSNDINNETNEQESNANSNAINNNSNDVIQQNYQLQQQQQIQQYTMNILDELEDSGKAPLTRDEKCVVKIHYSHIPPTMSIMNHLNNQFQQYQQSYGHVNYQYRNNNINNNSINQPFVVQTQKTIQSHPQHQNPIVDLNEI